MEVIRPIVRSSSPSIGFTEADIITQSLRAGGAMAILISKVDPGTIRRMGMRRSNIMIRYLHTITKRFTAGLAIKMFHNGDCTLIPPMHSGN